MDSVENALSTLRRTSFALVISALAILFLVAPAGRDFDSALDELSRTREILERYESHCAAVAAKAYASIAERIVETNSRAENPFSLSPSVGVAGWVDCGMPGANDPLDGYIRFFQARSGVVVAVIGHEEVYRRLARLAPGGQNAPALDSLFVLIDPVQRRGAEPPLRTVIHDGDSLRMQFVDSRQVRSVDSLSVLARFRRGGSVTGYSFRLPMAGTTEWREHPTRLDWLRSTDWGEEALGTRAGEVILFPGLQPFWEEVRTLTLAEAVRHLRARADQQRGNVEVFGAQISTRLLGWGGPLVVLAIILYFLAQLRHLTVIARDEPSALREFPWIALFNDRLSVTMVFAGTVLLPATANLAVSIRMAGISPLVALWAATAGVACAVAGGMAFARLRALRKAGPAST